MKVYSYLPITWKDSNGLHGDPVKNADAIIVYNGDHDSPEFEQLIHETTITELIEDFLDGVVNINTKKIDDPVAISDASNIKKKLKYAIEMLNNALYT